MENEIFVGLDIGTTKVVCIITELGENNTLRVVGFGDCPSDGLRKGTVIDIDRTVKSIEKAVKEAELMAGIDVSDVWVGIAGDHIKGMDSTGPVAISHENKEITQVDIDRVIEVAKAVAIPQDYEVLHVISQGYCVDDQKGIKNPLGMCGARLTTRVHIITGQVTKILDLTKCVEQAGLRLAKLVFEPLASSHAVLERDEKELGVALVDIGGGTTDIAVYYDENIRHIGIVALGGRNVTMDIGMGLRTPTDKAEEIKKKYGCAYQPLLREDERFMVPLTGGREDREVSREMLVGIIEPRIEEILSLAHREIKQSGYLEMLGAGIVLTGGGAMMEGIREKAENVFQLPVRIGVPGRFGGLTEKAKSPMHATGIGLCMFAAEAYANGDSKGKKRSKGDGGYQKSLEKMKNWFGKYF